MTVVRSPSRSRRKVTSASLIVICLVMRQSATRLSRKAIPAIVVTITPAITPFDNPNLVYYAAVTKSLEARL